MRSGTVETEGTIDHMSWLGLCSDQLEREREESYRSVQLQRWTHAVELAAVGAPRL